MPTFFLHSHMDLVSLAQACRLAATEQRKYADAQTSVSAKHSHWEAAEMYERRAALFERAAKQQEWMWVVHRKGAPND